LKRTLAFIADLHVGSRYALNPPEYTTVEGIKIKLNGGPLEIWQYWIDFCAKCDEAGVDTVVILGDMLDGQNHKENGAMLITSSLDEQKECASEILSRIVKNRKLIVIGGSGYHKGAGKNSNPEKDVCDRFGGTWLGPVKNVRFAPSKKLFNLTHGESGAYIYREMMMGREMLFARAAYASGKIPRIDVMARGHWHYFSHIHSQGMHFLQVPAWKAFEPSKIFLKSYGKLQPDMGGTILFLDDNDRVKVWPFLYPNPHIADGTIEA
jgi:hypothetical protein